MTDINVCIACLSSDIRMFFIGHTRLSEIYEKLTHKKLFQEDRIPKTMCYICYTQLQRCCSFINMAKRAGQTLIQLLNDGVQITQETLSAIDKEGTNNLVTAVLKPTSYIPPLNLKESPNSSSDLFIEGTTRTHNSDSTYVTDEQVTISIEKEHNMNMDELVIKEELITIKEEPIEESVELTNVEKHTTEEEQEITIEQINNILKTAVTHQIDEVEIEISTPKSDTDDSDIAIYKKKTNRRIRSKKKGHACDQCDKKFACHADLSRHLRVHTGEKPFVCRICSKGFSQNSHLAQHMSAHTGEKHYACHLCKNKAFTRLYNYKTHMKKHFGVLL